MATQKVGLVPNVPSNRTLSGGKAPDATPFRVYVMSVDDSNQRADIRVSRYSAILSSPDVNDRLLLVGTDLKLSIGYGDKIWVETFYDKNLTPVFAVINKGTKWSAQVVNPTDTTETSSVYPKEQEFITKSDVVNKLADLDATVALIDSYREAAIVELEYRKDAGILTQAQFEQIRDVANTQYFDVRDLVLDYKNNFNKFFDAAPTATWRKLFRTFTLIAYTTHDTNLDLDTTSINPKPPTEPTSSVIPQASQPVAYRLVQCLHSNLYLSDMCYQSRYPAKLPIPYHSPVYPFFENSKEEESVNTA